jgi:hypothetical protein
MPPALPRLPDPGVADGPTRRARGVGLVGSRSLLPVLPAIPAPTRSCRCLRVLTGGVVALVALSVMRTPRGLAAGSQADEPPVAPSAGPAVAWVGDSWLGGPGVGGPAFGIAARACATSGWNCSYDFEAASGWIASSAPGAVPSATSILQRSTAAAGSHPRMLVLVGGTEDAARGIPDLTVRDAAVSAVTRARAALAPGVPLVMVGPYASASPAPATATGVRDALAAVAKHFHLPFVDPIGESWPRSGPAAAGGTAVPYLDPQGLPTAAGTAAYAKLLDADLTRLGVHVTAASAVPVSSSAAPSRP